MKLAEICKNNWVIIYLIVLGLATRFIFIWWPNEVVFDEVHSGKIIVSYLTGKFSFFDIHPPLGKILVAFLFKITDSNLNFDFENIGENYGQTPYIILRFWPNFLGGLIPLAVFLLARQLNFSLFSAFLAGLFLVLDNALIVHSHFLMFDAFMLFFGFAGLAAFFYSRNRSYNLTWLIIAGVLLGSAISSKWTGLAFLAVAILTFAFDYLSQLLKIKADLFSADKTIKIKFNFFLLKNYLSTQLLKGFLGLLIVPATVYILVFAIHFMLITKPGEANSFLSPDFQTKSFWGKFIELNLTMYKANASINSPHPYTSKPWQWPIMSKSIYYWNKTTLQVNLL